MGGAAGTVSSGGSGGVSGGGASGAGAGVGGAAGVGGEAGVAGTGGSSAASCQSSRTSAFPGMGPIMEGLFCDDLATCATSADQAAAIEAASGGRLTCEPGPASIGTLACADSEWVCAWALPDAIQIDADDLAAICAITVLEPAPETVLCMVYL